MSLLNTRPPQDLSAPRRGFWFMRDIPMVVWLVLAVIATLVHRELLMPRWLMIHLLLLGAATHAILVWSQYFSFALLRSRASLADRRRENIRLILANVGAAMVLVGVPVNLWPVTLIGACALVIAVAWHAISIALRLRRSLPGSFGRTVRFYIVAAVFLVAGATIGTIIALGESSSGFVLAHAIVNLFGWIGLTVAGTVVTLWPTILRTRADEHAARGSAQALPLLAGGVVVAAVGSMLGWAPVVGAGVMIYLAGLVVIGLSLARAAKQTPPRSFAALSVAAALLWWIGALVWIIASMVFALLRGDGFLETATLIRSAVPFLAAGFVAQVLLGALSYLIPVVLGGGPGPVRVGTAGFDHLGPLRIAVANVGLFVCALPVSSVTRVVASALYLVALASFLVILFVAMRAQSRAKREAAAKLDATGTPEAKQITAPGSEWKPGRRAGQAVAGLLAVVLAVAISAAADPLALGPSAATGDPNAPVVTVKVEAADMRFTPSRIEVPVGSRLVVELTNTDATTTHDLVFANGVQGTRLAPGASETIDVGVITGNLDGWCSIVGHRQMGMTLTVVATGAPEGQRSDDSADVAGDQGNSGAHHSSGPIDLMADPGPKFKPYDAVLPPLPPATGEPTVHRETFTVRDTELEVAPGVTQTLWTFGDTAPGPVLRGRVGDVFEITLVNDGSIGHSIDFHAGALAPDGPMRTIAPGERLTYRFTATRAGIWMYHCSTMPMTAHIANGMYGAVIIEPDDLPSVDRSYVLVQGEYYLGNHDAGEVDVDKIATRNPDLVTFNGYANQYDHAPFVAKVGERVRVWVLDAGIERATSFHVIGGQFDTVWAEGAYLINGAVDTGSQALALAPAQGGFVELVFPEEGHYPFVSHYMIDAERGAHGLFNVSK